MIRSYPSTTHGHNIKSNGRRISVVLTLSTKNQNINGVTHLFYFDQPIAYRVY